MKEELFIDLLYEVSQLATENVSNRALEFHEKIDGVYLYAIGGFPIKKSDDGFTYFNNKIDVDFIQTNLKEAIGLSGIMTFMNKSNLTLLELGNICNNLSHLWCLNWIELSFLISVPNSKEVELSLLRDKHFYESWTVGKNNNEIIFTMTGSIKDFKKFISNKNDESFDIPTRNFMKLIDTKFNPIWNL